MRRTQLPRLYQSVHTSWSPSLPRPDLANNGSGVFDTSSGQTLYLWVDLKTDGAETFPYVIAALEPLRKRGYLTTVNGESVVRGPITVIGTGSTALDLVAPVQERDYFFDGPLQTLVEHNITKEISPIASCQLSQAVGEVGPHGLNETQVKIVEGMVKDAEKLGIKARYWDLPEWPVGLRHKVWEQVIELGVYLLNVDDLEAAAEK
jgi:hypothetical protein